MTTATESAMAGLAAALNASAALPNVRRDAVFDDVFEEFSAAGETFGRVLALRHGDDVSLERRLGEGPDAFEIVRNADVELFIGGPEGDKLATEFDAAIKAVFAAVEAAPTLAGAVIRAEIAEAPAIETYDAGGKAVLAALIRVQLTYTSSRPY